MNKSYRTRIAFCIFLVILAFILSACSENDSNTDRGGIVDLEYDSSNAGPIISGIEIEPRNELEEFNELYVFVTLENRGSQDLSQGEISLLVGYDESLIEMSTDFEDGISLYGYNDQYPGISDTIVEFDGYIGEIIEERSEVEVPLFITARFGYSTVLEQEVCINPDLYDVYGNCENPEGEVRTTAQYSPVVISSFEEIVSERLGIAYFTFHIENKGEGEVEWISIISADLTTEEMDCTFVGEGEVDDDEYIFESGEQTIDLDCEYHFDPNNVAMEKLLKLDLFYEYVLHETETLTVTTTR